MGYLRHQSRNPRHYLDAFEDFRQACLVASLRDLVKKNEFMSDSKERRISNYVHVPRSCKNLHVSPKPQ